MTRLAMRKCAGLVSDAGIRDHDETEWFDLPIFCAKPGAPTNLTRHHGVYLQVPIGCGGVAVYPGDVLVGDGDGVIVIPFELADTIAKETRRMEAFELHVLKSPSASPVAMDSSHFTGRQQGARAAASDDAMSVQDFPLREKPRASITKTA